MRIGLVSRSRRTWVIGGAVLLSALVLVAVFSLGVYVGRQGWGTGPPAVEGPGNPQQGPGQQQPPGGQAPQGPGQQPSEGHQAPWPPEAPVLQGAIRSVGLEGVAVDTPQGPRFVRVTKETLYARLTEQGEVEIEGDRLRPGQPVHIFGRLEPDGRTLTADRIVIVPPKQ